MSDSRSPGVYNTGSGQSCPQLSVDRDTDASNNGRVMQDLSGERSSMDGSKVHNGDIGSLYISIMKTRRSLKDGPLCGRKVIPYNKAQAYISKTTYRA